MSTSEFDEELEDGIGDEGGSGDILGGDIGDVGGQVGDMGDGIEATLPEEDEPGNMD